LNSSEAYTRPGVRRRRAEGGSARGRGAYIKDFRFENGINPAGRPAAPPAVCQNEQTGNKRTIFESPMIALVLVLLVSLTIAQSASPPLSPTPWPPVFSTTGWTVQDGVVYGAVSKYSWPHRGNRIDHAAGALECLKYYKTAGPCSLLWNATQMFGLFDNDCCVDSPVGTLPPTWGDNSTLLGIETVQGVLTYKWASGMYGCDVSGNVCTGERASHVVFG
jgi:hypothetical protein